MAAPHLHTRRRLPVHRHRGDGTPREHGTRRRRYPSDTSIEEWALLERLLPTPACQLASGGHPEKWPRREIVDAIRYVVDTGCKWWVLPADFPPFQTVFGFFSRWRAAGIFNLIRDQLRRLVRRVLGTSPHPVAVVIDSQSVKVAATVPRSTSGFDPGRKIPGRKRHIVVDMKGLLLFVMVTPADTHDAVAAREVLLRLRLMQLPDGQERFKPRDLRQSSPAC
ncbi:IS5 family transposase [Streptomyces sp. SID12488]|nr:IS5 family transposase [Streptomyces sp. SID12488]